MILIMKKYLNNIIYNDTKITQYALAIPLKCYESVKCINKNTISRSSFCYYVDYKKTY